MKLYDAVQPDEEGPVHFHHVTKQPLGLGMYNPSISTLTRLDASDRLHWMPELKRLMRCCKQQGCLIEETVYIIRYEGYVFGQPHSRRTMVRLPPTTALPLVDSHRTHLTTLLLS